jgi:hypothetical protein
MRVKPISFQKVIYGLDRGALATLGAAGELKDKGSGRIDAVFAELLGPIRESVKFKCVV